MLADDGPRSPAVVEVDLERKRIALSMKTNPEIGPAGSKKTPGRPAGRPSQGSAPVNKPVDWFTEALMKSKKK